MSIQDARWRLVLVDDHAIVRAGLRKLLEADPRCEVVGEAGTLPQLRNLLATTSPDLVVLDLTLGQDSGLDAIPHILDASTNPRIVVLTMHNESPFIQEALRRGAHGYVLKECAADELVRAIETVMAGGTYLLPELGARLARLRPEPGDRMSARERNVLRMLASGHTNAEIASELYVSLRTVEAHRASLRTRLGTSTRAELVEAARTLGLVP